MRDKDNIIDAAVARLNRILPLTARHRALDDPLQRLHKAILQAYIELGRTLSRSEMALHVDNINEAVDILKRNDLVVFDDDREPIGAYPFAMEKREHRVTVNNHAVHCMCALDALAVSPMFDMPTRITSCCHVTSTPVTIRQQGRKGLESGNACTANFGINWSAASTTICCSDSLCTEMIFLKDAAVAEGWLSEEPEQRQVFDLNDAIEFASRFFVPLIE